ncbi:MAG: PD-(D/E)XK nuclease family protein [Bacteroidales bacterium]|nr:PD-(D/E)XK nuclease family protein [Bacteroidales bacterium]
MDFFIESIARSITGEFGSSLNRHCLVFPGRRAGFYMAEYISKYTDKPVWSPAVYTVNDLFRSSSSLQYAANELLLFELYKVYRRMNSKAEGFDEFYFWGDMILNDFDDVDKYLADPSEVFMIVKDYKTIDRQFGSLSAEEVSVIKRFWQNFDAENMTGQKDSFLSLWSVMHELYLTFRDSLRKQGLAYEGMIFRELAENGFSTLEAASRFDMYHFIGFNALNKCEKLLMKHLRDEGRARFYWDYDRSFLEGDWRNSAGYFMGKNLEMFGNDMPADWDFDSLPQEGSKRAKRRIINASSDIGQVKLIPSLLSELAANEAYHTAIILADENLLMPLLSSLPENIGDINITMGYPLRYTEVYSLVRSLAGLQRSAASEGGVTTFGYREVMSLLSHSLLSGLLSAEEKKIPSELIRQNMARVPVAVLSGTGIMDLVFRRATGPAELSEYLRGILTFIAGSEHVEDDPSPGESEITRRNVNNEFIYRVILSLNRIASLISGNEIVFSSETYLRILERLLRLQSVPFSGEPLSGLQIMGILETRALDFKNLVFLSVNEGILPAVSAGSSFIPFTIREAFGLPSVNHQESVYSYHFFRLLQRAENVTFVFNSNTEGLRNGEMSRFLLQMLYESDDKPDLVETSYSIRTPGSLSTFVERTGEHQSKLKSRYCLPGGKAILSPSAVNTWLGCRMRFFYRYVCDLKEPSKISTDIDPAMLGSMLHLAIRNIYSGLIGKETGKEDLEAVLNDRKRLMEVSDGAVTEVMKKRQGEESGGNEIIVSDVLVAYLVKILKADILAAPLVIRSLEEYYTFQIEIGEGSPSMKIAAGGQVDRVDSVRGVTRIVDYKTGKVSDSIKGIDGLFAPDRKKDDDAWLQTLMYCEAWLASNPDSVVRPSVYKIRTLGSENSADRLVIRPDGRNEYELVDYNNLRKDFLEGFGRLAAEIFSPEVHFVMTEDRQAKCRWCPYAKLCQR